MLPSSEYERMPKDPRTFQSMAACLDRHEGSVFKAGTVSHLVQPVVMDNLHILLGAGCDDWGMCLYLTISDAAKLNAELSRLLDNHVASG